ncbi:fimbrial protein [Serratia fonticola]|uniref:fimbrial protein n=1 Tax=Serratia fonticola TaxID=47917 RepID=UPI001646F735|nr:fimbrial protein [Serratia fonticola]MBC3252456.1 fimbrial protein [Serratia fonticola]
MKVKLVSAIVPALFMMSSSAFAIEGETSTVIFNGEIVESTCALAANSKNQVVQLGSVSANTFGGAGGTSLSKEFTINLTDCNLDNATSATVTFSGDTATDKALNVTGGAEGVGLQILQNGTPLTLDGSAASVAQELEEGNNTMSFAARYVALADDVTAGLANATASFTLNYE